MIAPDRTFSSGFKQKADYWVQKSVIWKRELSNLKGKNINEGSQNLRHGAGAGQTNTKTFLLLNATFLSIKSLNPAWTSQSYFHAIDCLIF
jgi:hypothetical protein